MIQLLLNPPLPWSLLALLDVLTRQAGCVQEGLILGEPSLQRVQAIFAAVSAAALLLQSKGFVHTDLSTKNIMLDRHRAEYVLIDFVPVHKVAEMAVLRTTPEVCPPEVSPFTESLIGSTGRACNCCAFSF